MIHDENILQAMRLQPETGFRMLLAKYKEPIFCSLPSIPTPIPPNLTKLSSRYQKWL